MNAEDPISGAVEQPAEIVIGSEGPTPDLDTLLAEFETSNAINKESQTAEDAKSFARAKPGPVHGGGEENPAPATPENMPEGQQNAEAIEPTKQELHDFMYRVGSQYHTIETERQHELAQRDFKGVVDRVQKAVADSGVHVPGDYASNLIKARALEDAELRQAFDDRYKNPKRFNQLIGKLERGLVSKAREDQAFAEGASVAADREAVTLYLKGASSSVSPKEPKPNYGSMTDAEWTAEKKRIGLD